MAVIKYKDPITGEIKKVGTPIVDAYNKAETEEKLSSAIAQAENYTDRQVATLITENDARQLIEEAMSGFQPEGGGSGDVTVSNSFAKVKIGTTTISADAINDTLILMAGNNVTLTPDADNDIVTISATNTTYSAATASTNGLMTAAMVTKLNGIAAGANAYIHPSHTAKSSGLYKVTVDSSGHVSAATAVQKSDITALGIPAQDTTYSTASQSAAGLMSASDKSKLDNIAANANNYSLPNASSSTLGGVKIGSNISVSSGTISLTNSDVISALGYTPLSSAPVTSVNGATGAVSVTQLNGVSGGYIILQKTGDEYIPTIIGVDGKNKLAIQNNSGFPHIMSYHYYDQSTGTWLGGANIYSTVNKPTLAELGITSGTAALTAGSSSLATNAIYIQYE